MLRVADRWIWDSWIADDGDDYHLFFLYAPSALGDPALRHGRARIGHAVSGDLAATRRSTPAATSCATSASVSPPRRT